MSHHNDDFDTKLNQLYKQHKNQNKLSNIDKKNLLLGDEKRKSTPEFSWVNTLQFSLAAIALFTLFNLYFNEQAYLTSPEINVKSAKISITEIHYLEKNTYHKKIKYSHQQAKEQLAQAKETLKNQVLFRGRLINKADDWYIASCNKEILVQVNASLLQQLKTNKTLDNNIAQGDLLAFKHNSKGEIIALLKTDNMQQCRG
ncbi:hypothetical protein [Pseudoalteromonas denitrificans]|jgi:hypothetical protein|uniref:Uncharacterized protein n=1 Tax=Pseudoalteromonas denitrificans DSM 6059 TaxID=1123010 RepID=A0A1I1E986_9GAMM|nr:hypothetical protein [Pseudoalteromonas denitrificans]SFB83654.1 hypothetical protein SAMN02745724_00284 [Pseudoalteromonas denitrificans DSM 6059]